MTIKYLGSKRKIAKEILPIILADRGERLYVEPFVGSAAVIIHAGGRRLGADRNHHVIALHKAVRDGWEPPTLVTEAEYKAIKKAPSAYPKELVAFVGIGCSFAGKWFGGYARDAQGGNYARMQHDAIMADAPKFAGIDFICSEYRDLEVPAEPCTYYCDPPYADTTGYQTVNNHFPSGWFWRWCRNRVAEGHQVFVSEYKAPDDWQCVWEKTVSVNFDDDRDAASVNQATERLFTKRV